jgi:chitin disaccharide deacetylase
MRTLIVNGDDFGASHGVNLGIVEAHRRGVLTSASLMVDPTPSAEAARLSSENPELGVGLHVVIPALNGAPVRPEIERQLQRFTELTGRLPTHIDTHHNVHHDDRLLPAFVEVAARHGLPLRGHCGVRHIGRFYGQWDGTTHLEGVSPRAFAHIVDTEVGEGFNELCCHPGYADEELASSYASERRAELDTLCDPAAAAALSARGIRLATFREVQNA